MNTPSSSGISCPTARPRNSERRRSRSANSQRISCLFHLHDEGDGGREPVRVGRFAIECAGASVWPLRQGGGGPPGGGSGLSHPRRLLSLSFHPEVPQHPCSSSCRAG